VTSAAARISGLPCSLLTVFGGQAHTIDTDTAAANTAAFVVAVVGEVKELARVAREPPLLPAGVFTKNPLQ